MSSLAVHSEAGSGTGKVGAAARRGGQSDEEAHLPLHRISLLHWVPRLAIALLRCVALTVALTCRRGRLT